MIRATKLNGEIFYVNPYEIEFIEETPDTVVSLKSGKKVIVIEKAELLIGEMIDFYRKATPLGYNPLGGEHTDDDIPPADDEF